MKIKWNEDTTTKVAANSVVLIIAIAFYFIVLNIGGVFGAIGSFFRILSPFVTGFIIAYLLSRPVALFDTFLNKHLFKKAKKKLTINRNISICLTVIIVLLLVALIMYSLIPQLIDSVLTLARNMDGYIRSLNNFIDNIAAHFNLESGFLQKLIGSSQELFTKISQYLASQLPKIVDISVSLTSGISNFFIGFVVSIYMLSGKEHFSGQIKKAMYAIFPKKFVAGTLNVAGYMDDTFGKYLTGQILDSVILGIVCFIMMSILKMEYALLISIIIMLTNFIPFIGPIIGAVPSAFILLMVSPVKAFWFIILIIVLQQLESNLLAPRIVGKTTGLSAFWVVFAIILGGGLFGITGVILGVPAFSVIYTLVKNLFEGMLAAKGLPQKTAEYISKAT